MTTISAKKAADPEVIDDPIEVHRRLVDLGISENDFAEISRSGFAGLARCHNTNHPKTAGGFFMWAEMVCAAGDRMGRKGWTRQDYKNVSTILRPDERIAIGFARGDDGTGNSSADVSTKYPKGPATRDVIRRNRLNLNLPLDERYIEENESVQKSGPSTATYLLLYSRQGDTWRFELSLPKSINKATGFVEEWQTRLILPSSKIDPAPVVNNNPVLPNVPVKRRRAG